MTAFISEYQQRTEAHLDTLLSDLDTPARLAQAMRYSCLGGGKRIRALLVYAAGLALNAPLKRLDAVAAAIECIHCYSLIHDDLPAMDDDSLRRGNPTAHIQFDEATAILTGDALLTLAFEIIADVQSGLTDSQSRTLSRLFASAAGRNGMVGGQVIDILATGKELDRASLENMHARKTGALIYAAVMGGGHCAESFTEQQQVALSKFGRTIGLAFQVVDDILDIEASTEQLGKVAGADIAMNKSTYPALMGLEQSKQLAENLYHEAMESISMIGDNSANLAELAALIIQREN